MCDFFNLNPKILLNLLAKRIVCFEFLALIKKFIKSYFKKTSKSVQFGKSFSELPVLRSLLINVCLFELQLFIAEFSKYFNQNNFYKRYLVLRSIYGLIKRTILSILLTVKLSTQFWKFYDKYFLGRQFKMLYYNCWAKIFVIGVVGPRKDIFEIRNKIERFVINDLKFRLCSSKTIIVRFTINPLFFLGIFIKKNEEQKKYKLIFNKKNNVYTDIKRLFKISLKTSIRILFEKAMIKGFFKKCTNRYISTMSGACINLNNQDTLRYHNFIIYSIFNFYFPLNNKKLLTSFARDFKLSSARTLALKYKVCHASKVYKNFGFKLRFFSTNCESFFVKA